MSLNVYNFNEKSGICKIQQHGHEFNLNLYGMGQSNCFLTAIYEHVPEVGKKEYQLQWFFSDESHAKRMLGLKKTLSGEIENVFADEIIALTLYKNRCRQWQKIRNMFRQAFGKDFPIEIKESEE